MNTILVPTEFSDLAENTFEIAVQIAKNTNSEIKLLTKIVVNTLEYSLVDSAIYSKEEYLNESYKDAERELKRWKSRHPEVSISLVIKDENTDLTNAIVSENADLIIMGSKGASGWKELFSGSNTQHIVRNAECPVLVIKENTKELNLNKILYVTDFSHTNFIKKALKILNTKDSENNFVYIDTALVRYDAIELYNNMKQLAQETGILRYNFEIVENPTIEGGILEYAQEINTDLIIMYTHGRQGLDRLFHGSIAESLVNHSDLPIMTFVEA